MAKLSKKRKMLKIRNKGKKQKAVKKQCKKNAIKINKKVVKKTGKENVEIKKKSVEHVISEKDKKEMQNLFSDAYARQVMVALGGENALEVIRNYPYGVSDEEIARKLKVKISDIRSTLNRMHGEGFVEYKRRKDGETGWYSYSWSLNKKNIVEWAKRIDNEKNVIFNSEIEKYYCKKCGFDSLVDFVDASKNSFKCSCCNNDLEYLDKSKVDQLFGKLDPDQIRRRRMM
ncbi:MAG: hypothetical protein PHU63_03120 [Candidatus ainarchaeum sp.]|nr:hypothetical protein [Candidatus ainarchaeum sp.]